MQYVTKTFDREIRFADRFGGGPFSIQITGHCTRKPHVIATQKMGTIAAINVTFSADEARNLAKLLNEAADASEDNELYLEANPGLVPTRQEPLTEEEEADFHAALGGRTA